MLSMVGDALADVKMLWMGQQAGSFGACRELVFAYAASRFQCNSVTLCAAVLVRLSGSHILTVSCSKLAGCGGHDLINNVALTVCSYLSGNYGPVLFQHEGESHIVIRCFCDSPEPDSFHILPK